MPAEEDPRLRLAVPVKPARLETVMTEVACVPVMTTALLGFATTAKSLTLKLRTDERARPMLFPVTVTM